MNEFPRDFVPLWQKVKDGQDIVGFNGTEYIELVEAAGARQSDFPACQAVGQHRIWEKVGGDLTEARVAAAIAELKAADDKFHMDGASWTNNMSWVAGYSNVLEPMNQLSEEFHRVFDPLVYHLHYIRIKLHALYHVLS